MNQIHIVVGIIEQGIVTDAILSSTGVQTEKTGGSTLVGTYLTRHETLPEAMQELTRFCTADDDTAVRMRKKYEMFQVITVYIPV